jgi:hypothetical protein
VFDGCAVKAGQSRRKAQVHAALVRQTESEDEVKTYEKAQKSVLLASEFAFFR